MAILKTIPSRYLLSRFPLTAKVLISLMLISFSLTHISATLLVREVTSKTRESAEEYFYYKSKAALIRMTHQHSFGQGIMYAATGATFIFAGLPFGVTCAVLISAFAGAWLDHLSWFLIKYHSGNWEYLSKLMGTLFMAAFSIMLVTSFGKMFFSKQ